MGAAAGLALSRWRTLYAGLEAGGTKFDCVVGAGPDDIRAETRIPTTTPEATLREALEFFRAQRATLGPLTAAGIASFGPVDLDPASATYGFITSTPKPGWAHTDIVGPVRQALGVPVRFDTDVNAAALGEGRWGAAQGLDHFIYLTVGTGIGGGGLVGGAMMHGLVHPEMGHVRIPHDRAADPFEGHVPVPRRLPGGAGLRAGHERALGTAGGGACPTTTLPGRWRRGTSRSPSTTSSARSRRGASSWAAA